MQAYIFTMLTAFYIAESVHGHGDHDEHEHEDAHDKDDEYESRQVQEGLAA
jgi:hypothetical protein